MIHEDSLDVCFEGYVFRLQIVATNEVEAVQLAGIVLLFLAVTFSINLYIFFHAFAIWFRRENQC